MPAFEIPTFTVTINPLESNEMTFVPGSPPYIDEQSNNGLALEHQPLLAVTNENQQQQQIQNQQSPLVVANGSNLQKPSQRTIANTTIIVDDEVNKKLLGASEVQYYPLKHSGC